MLEIVEGYSLVKINWMNHHTCKFKCCDSKFDIFFYYFELFMKIYTIRRYIFYSKNIRKNKASTSSLEVCGIEHVYGRI